MSKPETSRKRGFLARAFSKAAKIAGGIVVSAALVIAGYYTALYPGRGEKLHDNEKELVEAFFSKAVDAGKIRKHQRTEEHISRKVPGFFIGEKQAITMPFTSHVDFFGVSNYSADFTRDSVGSYSLFLHEMVHVYQNQVCFNARGVGQYEYTIDDKTAFGSMGVEQQAAVVEDYARFFLHSEHKNSLYYRGADQGELSSYYKIRDLVEEKFPGAKNLRLKAEAPRKLEKTAVYKAHQNAP